MEIKNEFLKLKLTTLRMSNSLTLRELESHTGISNGYLSQLESGQIESPGVIILNKLAKFYDINLEEFL